MKKILKALLLTLLVAAMVLNTCGVVLANGSTTAEITVKEEVEDATAKIYRLVFSAKTPAGGKSVKSAALVFSYDNTIIQPINMDKKEKVQAMISIDNKLTNDEFHIITNDDYDFEFSPFKVIVKENRTAVRVDTYLAEKDASIDASEGMVFTEFYYTILDEEKIDGKSIKLETNYEEGSFLKEFYLDAKNAAPVKVGSYYYYGNENGTDTATVTSFTYTGSDKKTLGSLELAADKDSVNVPTTYPAQDDVKVTFTATAKSDEDAPMDVPTNAVWSVEGELPTGVTWDEATKTITVGKTAAEGTVTVKIACKGKEATKTVTIVKPAAEAKVIEAKAGETAIAANGKVTVVKPASTEPKTVVFTAKVLDQYNAEIDTTVTPVVFSVSEDDLDTGITFANNTLTVTNEAPKCNILAEAAYGELKLPFTIEIVDLEVNWAPVEAAIADNAKYGVSNETLIPVTGTSGTSKDGTVTGKFSVVDPTKVPNAGTATVYVEFTADNTVENGEYANMIIKQPFDVEIDKAPTTITVAEVQSATYDGTAKTIAEATITEGADNTLVYTYKKDGEVVAEAVNAGVYTVEISAEATTNYAAPGIKIVTFTINKAPVVITAAETQTATYDGTAKTIVATITEGADNTLVYTYKKDGEVVAEAVNAGTYTVEVSAEATTNYAAPETKVVTFTINKAGVTGFATEAPSYTYTAKEFAESEKTLADVKAALPATATVNIENNLTAEVAMAWDDATEEFNAKGGRYTFVGTPSSDNFELGELKLTATLTITRVTGTLTTALNNITVAQAALAAADSYDDIKFPTSIEVTYEGDAAATVIDSLTWTKTLDELKNVAVGTSVTVGLAADTFPAWATISGAGDITFAVTDIFPVNITVNMAKTGTYGKALEAATAEQVADKDGIDETVKNTDGEFTYLYTGTTENGAAYSSADVPTEAGTYTVTATLVSSTHAGSGTKEFTIAPKAITATVVVGNEGTRKYGDANPEFTYVAEGLVGEDTLGVEFETVAGATTPVGAYDVTPKVGTGNKNYAVEWTNGRTQRPC